MWYTILISLVVDFGGLLFVYLLLRDRVRRATSVESRMAEVRDEVSRLLVELNQATDRNIALMEDKIAALNDAISTADKKIGLLRRETEKHDVGSQIYSRLAEGRHPRAAAASPGDEPERWGGAESAGYRGAESEEPRREESVEYSGAESAVNRSAESAEYRDAESVRPQRRAPAASRAAASPSAPPTAQRAVERSEPEVPPLAVELSGAAATDVRQRVMMLYRAGFSPSLIASRVGALVGEVELIIALEQRKGQA